MPLHSIDLGELRAHWVKHIERLELWLRRLIDDQLSARYGIGYINTVRGDGSNVINKKIRDHIYSRIEAHPGRFPRPIDAATLEFEIEIICNPRLYEEEFRPALAEAYPNGCQEGRVFLRRLVDPRNKLFHGNPISVREAERIICYTNDLVESMKNHYDGAGLSREYVVPMIIRISDSEGNIYHSAEFQRNKTGRALLNLSDDRIFRLRPGDTYSLEVVIDNPVADVGYEVRWSTINGRVKGSGERFVFNVTKDDVRTSFGITCAVISDLEWHRCGDVDDLLYLPLKVLPPVE